MRLLRHKQAIMHPLPLPTGSHDPEAAQIGKMPRDLRLWRCDHLSEIANANLLLIHQVDNSQSRRIRKSAE